MYQHLFDTMLRFTTRASSATAFARRHLWLTAGPAGMAGMAAAVALLIAACAGAGTGARSSPVGLIDHATKTVQLNVIIDGSTFNGYSDGQLTVRVPRGWRVDVFCSNHASRPESCAVVSGAGSTTPAFPGAACPSASAGVRPGTFVDFAFTPKTVGSYRLASLVPGRRHDGLWVHFDVVAAGSPSVSTGSEGPAGGAAVQ